MKNILWSLLFFSSAVLAEVTNIEISGEFVEENKIKIIDIRTESEWKEMGVISGAHLITFFAENKQDYIENFLEDLNGVVEKDEQFAIISNTASRTKLVSNFLGHKHNYNVINLIGGMSKLLEEGYEVEVYNPDKNSTIK
jgi:rhodanese-related sulfurtransferase